MFEDNPVFFRLKLILLLLSRPSKRLLIICLTLLWFRNLLVGKMLMWKNVDVDTAILGAVIGQVDKDIFLLKVDVTPG